MVSNLPQQNFLNPQEQAALLRLAAQVTGRDPAAVLQMAQSGQAAQLLGALPGDRQQQAAQLLQDPAALERLLQSPQAQAVLGQILGRR